MVVHICMATVLPNLCTVYSVRIFPNMSAEGWPSRTAGPRLDELRFRRQFHRRIRWRYARGLMPVL